MKFFKIIAVSLFLIILMGTSACSIGQNTNTPTQTAVTKGDLTVKVNATGKTSYSSEAKLAFGSAGKIKTLNIKKGDAVTKGTVLARLETEDLELALSQAKLAEATAKIAITQAQMTATQANIGVTQAQQDVTQAEAAQIQAESALTAAQFNLDKIQAVGDIKDKMMKLQMAISNAEVNRQQANLGGIKESSAFLTKYIVELNQELERRNSELQKLLAKDEYAGVASYEVMAYNPMDQVFYLGGQQYNRLLVEDIQMKQQQVVIAQKSIELTKQTILKAQQNVEQAKQNVEKSKQGIEQANLSLEQTTKAVKLAQKQLDSAVILAPFDGIIADLGIKQDVYIITAGLSAGTPVYMVQPESLEINTEVDEIDITAIQVGQKALIGLDAVPGQQVEGKVTAISWLPVVKAQNSGVVVYQVKIGFNGTPPDWAKSGMSASVDIITAAKKGVVVIPNKALKGTTPGQKTVSVLVDQKSQEKAVTVGLSDGIQTEVISGINEGEIILINR